MKTILFIAVSTIALAATIDGASARVVRGGYYNAAGGVTAGGAHDVRGAYGGRAVGEGGVVTNGDGGGVAGSRGCGRDAAGGAGCRSGATAWDRNGNVAHEGSAVFEGPLGGYGSASGGWTRDSDGDINGARSGEYTIGDRTYSAETSVESGEGVDRSVSCSGSGCR
ncbi:MAG: hypothetical protein GC189_12290 [Alphaproteobacteria bacterium]|nr:hypothetical protein [Alphaproteobacteria bacterium]